MSEKKLTSKLKAHVFICTNTRPAGHERGCCQSKGSEDLLIKLKKRAAARGVLTDIRIQKAGCLDVCENGPAMVVYPEGVWYGPVKETDLDEIIESHLIAGAAVKRLMIPDKM